MKIVDVSMAETMGPLSIKGCFTKDALTSMEATCTRISPTSFLLLVINIIIVTMGVPSMEFLGCIPLHNYSRSLVLATSCCTYQQNILLKPL